jgi:predicted DCC family thiol-disulfide oxidoreductase YuxK
MSALTAPRDELGGDAGGRVGQGANAPDATIVYDGQCPFCSRYVQLVRLRRAVGSVKLVDAREGGPLVEELMAAGFDLDEGMVLKLGDRLYHGNECVHMLSLLSTPSDSFNKINRLIFRSRRASRLLYPVLRGGRNLVLAALGRTKIHQRGA